MRRFTRMSISERIDFHSETPPSKSTYNSLLAEIESAYAEGRRQITTKGGLLFFELHKYPLRRKPFSVIRRAVKPKTTTVLSRGAKLIA